MTYELLIRCLLGIRDLIQFKRSKHIIHTIIYCDINTQGLYSRDNRSFKCLHKKWWEIGSLSSLFKSLSGERLITDQKEPTVASQFFQIISPNVLRHVYTSQMHPLKQTDKSCVCTGTNYINLNMWTYILHVWGVAILLFMQFSERNGTYDP